MHCHSDVHPLTRWHSLSGHVGQCALHSLTLHWGSLTPWVSPLLLTWDTVHCHSLYTHSLASLGLLHSLTGTGTLTDTHVRPTHSLSLTHFHSLTFTHSLSLTHFHSLTDTHSLTLTHSLTHFHSLTHSHSLTLTHSLSLTHSHSLTLTHSLTHSLTH